MFVACAPAHIELDQQLHSVGVNKVLVPADMVSSFNLSLV